CAASWGAKAGVATARIVPTALARYSTCMPRGIQRIDAGRLTSVVRPPTHSARLHRAIACTAPRRLVTRRRWAMVASPWPGRSSTMRGAMPEKWGALRQTRRENSHLPGGRRSSDWYRRRTCGAMAWRPWSARCRSGGAAHGMPRAAGTVRAARAARIGGRSGGFAPRAFGIGQVAVAGRAQFLGVEVVDHDRVEGQLAQLFELGAFLGRDPALAHALVELRPEVQRLDVAVLERLEEF